MNFTWADSLALILGLVTFGVYLARCRAKRNRPTLPAALVCILSGGPIAYGLVLIPRPWWPALREIPMQPVHEVMAGVALVWIGWEFIRSVWIKPGSLADATSTPTVTPTATVAEAEEREPLGAGDGKGH
jgi:hypothetical protein